jgi:DNA recombination protein RmuC
MDNILYLVIGVILGVAAGFFIGASRSKASAGKTFEVEYAAANAKAEALQTQINQLEAARIQREAKDAQENKLLQELAPVKEQLDQMRTAVTQMEATRIENLTELRDAIKANLESDELLRKQTQVLSTALSSNSVRGVWGEAQLRRLVELAGLLKHADFDEQATITAGRADMIINLPGGKQLAIDSKVPYNSYQEASQISELSEGGEKARRDALIKEHVKAVRKHIDDLATREYWNALNASPDFVIAFIPSESLLSASLEADPAILEYAFGKNVALASPVSLFSVLKTINYIWRQNVDESQVRQLIKLGKELYERVEVVAEKADKLGNAIKNSVVAYNGFISSFESRFLVTARKLNNLDENQLATSTIDEPKAIEETPKQWTSNEAIEAVTDEEKP